MKNITLFLKKNKIAILLVLLAVGLFYWFSLNPYLVKRSCYHRDVILNTKSSNFSWAEFNDWYASCLHKNGY